MTIEKEKIRAGLLKKGFEEGGTKHDLYKLTINGRAYPIGTKLSRGSKYKDYGDDLISDVCHQLSLTKKELVMFLECSLSLSEYVDLLAQRGRIREPN